MQVVLICSRTIYVINVYTVGIITIDVNIVNNEAVIVIRIKGHDVIIYVIFITAIEIQGHLILWLLVQ